MASAPPEPPSPTMTATLGDPEHEARVGGARDRLGLAAFFRVDSRPGAGGVDERDDRQVELVGKLHQPDGLAIALGPRHAKIVYEPRGGVFALLMADDADRLAAKPPEAADDRGVLGELAVAAERGEFGDQPFDIIAEMRAVLHPSDLNLLPRRQRRVEVGERLGGPASSLATSSLRTGELLFSASARSSSTRASISATGVSKLK